MGFSDEDRRFFLAKLAEIQASFNQREADRKLREEQMEVDRRLREELRLDSQKLRVEFWKLLNGESQAHKVFIPKRFEDLKLNEGSKLRRIPIKLNYHRSRFKKSKPPIRTLDLADSSLDRTEFAISQRCVRVKTVRMKKQDHSGKRTTQVKFAQACKILGMFTDSPSFRNPKDYMQMCLRKRQMVDTGVKREPHLFGSVDGIVAEKKTIGVSEQLEPEHLHTEDDVEQKQSNKAEKEIPKSVGAYTASFVGILAEGKQSNSFTNHVWKPGGALQVTQAKQVFLKRSNYEHGSSLELRETFSPWNLSSQEEVQNRSFEAESRQNLLVSCPSLETQKLTRIKKSHETERLRQQLLIVEFIRRETKMSMKTRWELANYFGVGLEPRMSDLVSVRLQMVQQRPHAIASTEKMAEVPWEPGGSRANVVQWYWPEKCQSLFFSAATSDTGLMRRLYIQPKDLHSEFQDMPRLLVGASEFGAKVHKPPDRNKKMLGDETLGNFRRVKKLIADMRFNLVLSKEDYILLESVVKWKFGETSEAEVHHGGWNLTVDVSAEWVRPKSNYYSITRKMIIHKLRAYFHVSSEKMVYSVRAQFWDARFLVKGLGNCIHCFEAERVWEPGGLSAEASRWNWPEKYHNRDDSLKLTSKLHRTCVHALGMSLNLAREIQDWTLNEEFSLEIFSYFNLEARIELAVHAHEYEKQLPLFGYSDLEVQVRTYLHEFDLPSIMAMRTTFCWRIWESFLWSVYCEAGVTSAMQNFLKTLEDKHCRQYGFGSGGSVYDGCMILKPVDLVSIGGEIGRKSEFFVTFETSLSISSVERASSRSSFITSLPFSYH